MENKESESEMQVKIKVCKNKQKHILNSIKLIGIMWAMVGTWTFGKKSMYVKLGTSCILNTLLQRLGY